MSAITVHPDGKFSRTSATFCYHRPSGREVWSDTVQMYAITVHPDGKFSRTSATFCYHRPSGQEVWSDTVQMYDITVHPDGKFSRTSATFCYHRPSRQEVWSDTVQMYAITVHPDGKFGRTQCKCMLSPSIQTGSLSIQTGNLVGQVQLSALAVHPDRKFGRTRLQLSALAVQPDGKFGRTQCKTVCSQRPSRREVWSDTVATVCSRRPDGKFGRAQCKSLLVPSNQTGCLVGHSANVCYHCPSRREVWSDTVKMSAITVHLGGKFGRTQCKRVLSCSFFVVVWSRNRTVSATQLYRNKTLPVLEEFLNSAITCLRTKMIAEFAFLPHFHVSSAFTTSLAAPHVRCLRRQGRGRGRPGNHAWNHYTNINERKRHRGTSYRPGSRIPTLTSVLLGFSEQHAWFNCTLSVVDKSRPRGHFHCTTLITRSRTR
ncbi:hypothetical protein J6590_024030 [Homalodisca vitripennis]|nr:hypothetical protein J6590_024030 [Homalodisca vitripennis]